MSVKLQITSSDLPDDNSELKRSLRYICIALFLAWLLAILAGVRLILLGATVETVGFAAFTTLVFLYVVRIGFLITSKLDTIRQDLLAFK